MKLIPPAQIVLVMFVAVSIIACTTPTAVHPIGITRDGTEYRLSCRDQVRCITAITRICPGRYEVTAWWGPGRYFVCRAGKQPGRDEPVPQPDIQVLISPECKEMFFGPDFIDEDENGKLITEKRPKPDYVPWNPASAVPMAWKDPRTSITIYVETDGRHLAATDAQGHLLWVRNPWQEAQAFCPYRTARPVVAGLRIKESTQIDGPVLRSRRGNPKHPFLEVTFDSSQYGLLDESTGDFFAGGQN